MIAVEPAGIHSLLVQIFVRHDHDHPSTLGDEPPPTLYRVGRMVHVLETMTREHHVESVRDAFIDLVRVTVAQIEAPRMRNDFVRSASDVEHTAGEPRPLFLGHDPPRLRGLVHGAEGWEKPAKACLRQQGANSSALTIGRK